MANTIKIKKSKNLIFKKLNFLYLVFILFLFLTSPGGYVAHYNQLGQTQSYLNQELQIKWESLKPQSALEHSIKDNLDSALRSLDRITTGSLTAIGEEGLRGEKMKESKFANQVFLKGELGAELKRELEAFTKRHFALTGVDLSPQLLNQQDFAGQTWEGLEFYFKDCPNAVAISLLKHFRSTLLMAGIQAMRSESLQLVEREIKDLQQLSWVESFSERLPLNTTFMMKVQHREEPLSVWINGIRQSATASDSGRSLFEYTPPHAGRYRVDLLYEGKRYQRYFKVYRPGLSAKDKRKVYRAQLGQPLNINLVPQFFPTDTVWFTAQHANLERAGSRLLFTPFKTGLLSLVLNSTSGALDSLPIYVDVEPYLKVTLSDAVGDSCSWEQAVRLQATDVFWRVKSYRAELISPAGESVSIVSQTRLLSPRLQQLLREASKGSLLLLDQILLAPKSGAQDQYAQPTIIRI